MGNTDIQIEIIKKILSASDEQIKNFHFLYEQILNYGVYPFRKLTATCSDCTFTPDGLSQAPAEFAAFCSFLSSFTIRDAIEIGVYRGRSSYMMCAILYRSNPGLSYYMVDLEDQLDEFERFRALLPVYKKVPATSKDFQKKRFDFVFIDADHSYRNSLNDYLNVGQYAGKLVCFHDIYAHEYDRYEGGIVRTWNEVCLYDKSLTTCVFSQFPGQWMGIGVGIKRPDRLGKPKDEDIGLLIRNADKRLEDWKNQLAIQSRVYLYGAGYNARIIYRYLKKCGIDIMGFVVSNDQIKPDNLLGKNVYRLKELGDLSKDFCFAMALSECHQSKIIELLHEKGYQNLLPMSDLIFYDILGNQTEEITVQ